MTTPDLLLAEVEEPLGPGVDFEFDAQRLEIVGRRARDRGLWLGLDRGRLLETDDGTGRALSSLIAVPASTYAGARLFAEPVGGLAAHGRILAVLRLPGARLPIDGLIRVAAGGDFATGTWVDARTVAKAARAGRRAYRERRARERVVDGRAWQPESLDAPEQARFTTPHSAAEYSLTKLPPRFVRGLEAIMEPDERVLYWVERPQLVAADLVERLRRRDRRAALLLLTDQQVCWLVDHADPDRFLSDWGVDIVTIPVERLSDVVVDAHGADVRVEIRTARGATHARLPSEMAAEARVFGDLARRFLPESTYLPRRVHETEAVDVDWNALAPFGVEPEVRRLIGAIGAIVEAAVASPRRDGHPRNLVLAVAGDEVLVAGDRSPRRVRIQEIHAVEVALSTLAGHLGVTGTSSLSISLPATLAPQAAAVARLIRRKVANS